MAIAYIELSNDQPTIHEPCVTVAGGCGRGRATGMGMGWHDREEHGDGDGVA